MARVSKAVSCQSAVMRTAPPNDPPVTGRRSEAGDWGIKCLQIGRQFGNSSGDGDVARRQFGTVATGPIELPSRCYWGRSAPAVVGDVLKHIGAGDDANDRAV